MAYSTLLIFSTEEWYGWNGWFQKQVTSLEIDPFMVNFVKSRFAGTDEGKKLKVIQGPALDSLEKIKESGETFDLVFIDADKMNYMNYYKVSFIIIFLQS